MKSLIIFLHFHKAGGTSINHAFNRYQKYCGNLNGNPAKRLTVVDYWNYTKEQLHSFVGSMFYGRVEFICLEWNFFVNYDTIDYRQLDLITCIRDPYHRFLSCLSYYERSDYVAYNQETQLCGYRQTSNNQKFPINVNKYNYYVKMLNGLGQQSDIEVNHQHLEIAKNNLHKFSAILILENPQSFRLLHKYGINHIGQHNKSNKYRIDPNTVPLAKFKHNNQYDYKLYDYACSLSNKQLEKLSHSSKHTNTEQPTRT